MADNSTIVDFRINETLQIDEVSKPRLPGGGKIRAITPVGAVSNRTASAQLETAPTKHGERKCLFIFMIHYKLRDALTAQNGFRMCMF